MKQPIKMTPGDDLHLTALMAPFSLNLVTGQDRQHLLGYGRAAFIAGHAQLRASTPEAAEDLIEEIIERISDHAVKAMAHQEARKQGNPEQIESARQAIFQAEDCIKRDLRTLASRPEPTSVAAEQAAWHAGLDEGRVQAAPAAVAVPDLQDMLRELRVQIHKITVQLAPTSDCSGVWMAHDKMSTALAASPAADAKPFLSEDDLDDLRRFEGMASDGESYDIAKKRMKRLAELGVVRWVGGSRYCMTAFGQYVLKCWDHLPLETHEEANARANAEFRARIGRLNAEAIASQSAQGG